MINRRAILQVADTGPLESLVIMLRSVDYECYTPSDELKKELRAVGCDTVLDIRGLVSGMGYTPSMPLPEAGLAMMDDPRVIYVDVKGHRNGSKVVGRWPHLKNRILWYRINGGAPEHVINDRGDHGNEVDPPCPVLTPNQWYKEKAVETTTEANKEWRTYSPAPWSGRAYACWPPFYRQDEYYDKHQRVDGWYRAKRGELSLDTIRSLYQPPVCLIHNVGGWGYIDLVDPMRKLGVKFYGTGAPDGLLQHRTIAELLSRSLAMVHLKSNDAPGYAIYECLAAACPLVCTRRLIWRCRMQDLLIPGETCLVFDRETHDGLTPQDVEDCTAEVAKNLEWLKDPEVNRRIGQAGRQRLLEVMWSEGRSRDVESLREFLQRHYD